MAIAKAYGSITIVDIGDLGTLSVYPESNQPISVIYDPNTNNGTYNPNWESNNLKLTPVIYYGGTQINANNTAISVVWQRKVEDLTKPDGVRFDDIQSGNGESMIEDSKKLIVNKNVLNSGRPIVTYVCSVTYTEPQTGVPLNAKGEISFSLISQPTSIKSCSIVGESVFLYRGDKSIKGAEEITLTAKLSNCDVHATDVWQYKTHSGSWQTISGQLGTTLKIKAATDLDYFVNDVATIRFNTNIDTLYDVHSITKIYDGAAGTSTFAITLSNEDMYVPCDQYGNIVTGEDGTVLGKGGGLENAITEIKVYNGDDNITNDPNTNISVSGSGVSGTWFNQKTNDDSETNKPTYRVTDMSAMTGTITFTVTYTKDGKTKTDDKTFYLTKLLAGVDGKSPTIHSLEVSTVTLSKTAQTHIYSPSQFTVTAWQTVDATKTPYEGRIKIYQDDKEVGTSDEKNNDRSSRSWMPPSGTAVSTYRVELYASGGSGQALDTQTITVISDGDPGTQGPGGLSFILGNYSDHIPCSTNGTVLSDYTLTIPFAAYQGTNRVACKATWPTTTIMSITATNATTSADGIITINVAKGATLSGTSTTPVSEAYDTGTITFTLETIGLKDAEGQDANQTGDKVYTWTKNREAASGADAVLLRMYAPNGNIINNGENDVQLSCVLTEGTTTVTPDKYTWSVFHPTSNTYVEINSSNTMGGHTGYTSHTLNVPKTAVSSYASYCVEVEYKDEIYKDYISVQDKTDPLQVEIFSTLGDKITNSVGIGCIYARVYQNGIELDELQNLRVSTTEPISPAPSSGDVWAHIDESTKTIILKKRVNNAWEAFNLVDTTPASGSQDIQKTCNYKWTFGDYDGVATNLNNKSNSTDKFLYIQGSYIAKKMQFNLEVTKK